MMQRCRLGWMVSMTLACFIGVPGHASPPTDSIEQRIAALEAELARLTDESRGEDRLDESRASMVRALVQDIIADADTRASLLSRQATAGFDNGFFIASADNVFRLNVNGQMQSRYIFNHQSNSPVDNNRGGFELARMQLVFAGHVIDPGWTYRVQGNFARGGGVFFLEDAFIGRDLGAGWSLRAGQFRLPFLRDFLVAEMQQQIIERSLVHQEMTLGRAQGAMLQYRDERIGLSAAFSDGLAGTGGFNTPALMRTTEYALTGRFEALLEGTWAQFNDQASRQGDAFGVLAGAAIHYQRGEYGTTDDELEVLQWTLDASIAFGGANLFAYFVGRHLDDSSGSLDQYAFVVQGGYFLTEDLELYARYEWGDDDASSDDLHIITVGVNHYFARHRLKWSADVGFAIDGVGATWGSGQLGSGGGMAGWRTDAPGEDGQIVLRTQMQIVF